MENLDSKSTKTESREDAKTGIRYRMTKTKPANFSDLKAKFDSAGGVNATNVKNTKISTTTTSKQEVQTTQRFQRNSALRASKEKTDDDLKDLLSHTKFTIGAEGETVEPKMAVSKVFRGSGNKVCQATVENKLQRHDSGEMSLAPSNKNAAMSILSTNLALARIRPGSGGKKEDNLTGNIQQSFNVLSKNSQSSVTTTSSHRETNTSGTKTESRSYTSKYSSSSSQSSLPKEPGLSFSKDTLESSHDKLSRNNSSGSDLSDTRSNVSRNNSFNKISANSKPRPFSPNSKKTSETSVTQIVKKQSSLTRTSSAGSEDARPEWLKKREVLVSNFQTRLKHKPVETKTETKNSSSELHTKVKEMKSEGDKFTSNGVSKQKKLTRTLDVDRNVRKHKDSSSPEPQSPRGYQSPRGTNSPTGSMSPKGLQSPRGSLSPRDSTASEIDEFNEIRKNIFKRRESNKDMVIDRSHSLETTKQVDYTSKKMTADYFQKLKSDFEHIAAVADAKQGRKPKLQNVKTSRTFDEQKHSFESPRSPTSPKSKLQTLRRLQDEGQIPNVRAVSSALNLEFGRPRAASTGSITADLYTDNIYEAMGEEYHDFEGFEKYEPKAWPDTDSTSSDNEGIYDYIKDTDPKGKVEKKVQSKTPARRYGQKRKGTSRPSFNKDQDVNHHDPSSSEITEGSSKEGTMESTDERCGVDGDIEYDTDSSGNSGIYEPINPDQKKRQEEKSSNLPPELPADRKKKKKDKDKDKQGKTFGSKLKQMYKSKPKDGVKDGKKTKMKHVTSDPALPSQGSSGMLNKLGKFYKRVKSENKMINEQNEQEEVVISSSDYDGSDTNPIEENTEILEEDSDGISMHDIDYIDASSTLDNLPQPPPKVEVEPPLPPKPQKDEPPIPPPPRTGEAAVPPPPLPPRLSIGPSSIPEDDLLSSPPLPPRERLSMTFDLDTIVPISLGKKSEDGKTWPGGRDSYLHGHHVKSASDLQVCDEPVKSNTEDTPPPRPSPPIHRRKKGKEDYILPDPGVDDKKTDIVNGKQPLDKRPSSGYLRFGDISGESSTDIQAPFSHLYKFKNQLKDDDEGNQLYIELNDDMLYGTMDRRYTTKFESEPLYQVYNKDKVTRASRKFTPAISSDSEVESGDEGIYEAVDEILEKAKGDQSMPDKPKMSTLEMFGKTGSVLRALWSEMPEVKESGFLNSISSQERKIQESMFEIITSEASYLKSLNILIDTFLKSQEFSAELSDKCVINRQERHVLFSNIGAVREASESFLSDLEARWQKSCLLSDVCDIIYLHGINKFECYVCYCSNQTFQERAIQELVKRQEFNEALRRIERSPECQGLPMTSFLLLPMQRITRLPLLVDAICHRLSPGTERHKSASRALDALSRVVKKCNEGARRMQQTEQMCLVVQNLEFKVKEIPLISASRYLVKQGELTRLVTETSSRLPFGKGKPSKQSIYLYLFSDLLLVSKKKGVRFSYPFTPQNLNLLFNNQYVVTDYALRNALHVENVDHTDKSRHLPQGAPSGCKNIFVVVLLENYEHRQVELVLTCKSPSDKSRWIDALSPVTKETDNEKIYEEWDCPQVQCTRKYISTEPDELSLEESDVVNVFKKMADGWYEGERIRDGERGWFPANCTEEIVNSHVRARNLRLRYRLLAASEEYSSYNNMTTKA
ncbi:uncharacterized protein [Mytilus edulis]|uniref:uncharacterized protein isoform X2 n=1 Tax=Mytilus edulis TaxID=6550 RepID=UPI0039EF35F6